MLRVIHVVAEMDGDKAVAELFALSVVFEADAVIGDDDETERAEPVQLLVDKLPAGLKEVAADDALEEFAARRLAERLRRHLGRRKQAGLIRQRGKLVGVLDRLELQVEHTIRGQDRGEQDHQHAFSAAPFARKH